ncbi:MAG TPA: amino acid adenylation domain-containing protein, partial [Pyrinomonadaceae bacterium]|nr:amino acid adenylation domain-containing protein [Pyrinomonadaceae bacterium]
MKLLLTMNLPYTRVHGGANRSNRGLCAGLARSGHKVRVIVPALATPTTITLDHLRADLAADGVEVDSRSGVDVFTVDGVEVYSVTEPSRLRFTLVEQLRDYAPDWALVSSEDPSQSLLDAAHKNAPGRVIYLAHTPPLYPFGPESLYPGEARTDLVRQAAGTVTISKWTADYVKRWSGIDAVCIHFPHYGTPPWPKLASLDNPNVLLMNASAVKGLTIFLQLADALPSIQFAALPGYATTQADLAAISTCPNVTLLPNAKNLVDILRQTRILLMPSLWLEGFGMAAVDAMLHGIPVLAAAFGGLLEAKLGTDYLLPVRPIERFEKTLGDNMLPIPIVPEQDIQPWLHSLTSLLTDPTLYEGQSAAARAAATAFASKVSADQFVEWLGTLKTRSASASIPVKPQPNGNLAALTPQQRAELVERLKQKALAKADGSKETARIPVTQRDRPLPLSFAQQRLWFIEKLEPGRYNVAVAFGINGPLRVDLLARSLNEVIARHEILRTTFLETDGQPEQIIASELKIDLPAQFLSTDGGGPFDDIHRPFDLARGPLLRPLLLKRAEDKHLLVLTMHHIVSDGWSTGVLTRELSALYDAYLHDRPSPLSPLPIQYIDYAVWQREYLQGEVLERQLSYWKEQLAEAPALLDLPTDRPRPNVQSGRGAAEIFSLPEELSAALRQLSRHKGVTLFMTLLAAFKILLHRYSGQEDLVIGSPIAGRNRREVEGLIGFFVNTLALRTRLSGNPTFSQLLKQVREVCLNAYAHQEFPFERLVEELQPERSLSHNPIVQVLFELENRIPGRATAASRSSESWAIDKSATAMFELILSLRDTGRQLDGVIEYSTDLFTSETIQRMAQHFSLLLACIVRNPAGRISDFPIISAHEERKLLEAGSGSEIDYSHGRCLHRLFEAQAERSPTSVAIRCNGELISRADLNRRANQLAHYLQTMQIGPETLVGICMGRGIEIVIAMLATLKAGAAYVPIDPSLPAERIDYLLQDTCSPIVLTLERHRHTVEHNLVKVVCLDSDWQALSHHPEENCASTVTAENLAYVMYTSGSTGNPKGVAITHQNLNWLVHNLNQLEIKESDTVGNASNPAFDAIVYEVWCGLLHGARVEVIANETMLSAAELGQKLRESGVTVLYVTAALFTPLASQDPTIFSSVRTVVTGGESLAERWAWEVIQRGRPNQLIHEYGPTEATVFSSIQVVEQVEAKERNLPIGRPLSNTTSYVLDKQMRLVPVGVVGELYIGGDGVARGYWGSAEQTAARFVPDPYNKTGGQRLYRTGDFVKWRPSGVLEFAGRADDQVKIRGYRVELAEVEAALSKIAGVKESVVLVCDEEGEKRLVGYVVGPEGTAATRAELRRRLKEKLPEYMIPSTFVAVERMPLTANGKVDRRRLLTIKQREYRWDDAEQMGIEEEQQLKLRSQHLSEVKAGNAAEELLTGIFAELLRVDEVKADDNFFELGGHSLLAMRLTSRIRDVFGAEISPRTVFESPTVAGLAQEIEAKRGEDGGEPTIALRRVSRAQPLPLSYAQERLWFLDQLHPGSTAYIVAIGKGFSGALDVDVLRASFNELIRRHESLRTTFAALEGEPVQIIAEKQELNLPVVDLTTLPATTAKVEAARIVAAEVRQRFVLSEGPLLRASLLRTAPTEHLLFMTMHHIISDHLSLGVLFGELFTLYYAYLRGENSPLAELPIQYADYAVWQKNYLQGELLQTQLAYWDEQLAGAPELIDLRTDFPRPATRTTTGRSELFTVPIALSESLRRLSRSEGVTAFMALLAAFQVLLYKYSGQTDIVIGSPIAGRQRSELEGLIGFFVNTLALRVDLSGNPTFGKLLRKVREVCLGAYAHQDLPFERLVEELQPERSLSHNPLIQVMFQLENVPRGAARQSNQIPPPQSETAIFDLVLSLRETGEELQGTIEYSTDLFAAPTIQRMAQHFLTLLEQIVANPKAQLAELSLLPSAERDLLLSEWSGAQQRDVADAEAEPKSSAQLVHTLFEQHAARTPGATAISFAGRSVSYAELNRLANQLARYLISRGVSSESLVGIMLPRSPELIVALLATLKAGGAYLPLDPTYPAERLASMSEDAEVSLLLTTSDLRPLLSTTSVPVICLDEVAALCSEYNADDLRVDVGPENLAYVIYTSGSSGAPKDVMISHAALAEYLPVVIERLNLTAADRFLQFASASFDVAVEEIFPTLAAGAQLVLCEQVPYGDEFNQMLEREQVSVCELPTAYWQEWVREMHSQQQSVPAGLRLVI